MKLLLRMSNIDQLPDGGPVEFMVENGGCEIGRSNHMDWTLPDDNRYISSRHCEIKSNGNVFQLIDVSVNGTMINGSPTRMQSQHDLRTGDKIGIGHYLIDVEVLDTAALENVEFAQMNPDVEDIWGGGTAGPPPVERSEFMGKKQSGRRSPDFSNEFIEIPLADERRSQLAPEPMPSARVAVFENPFSDIGNGAHQPHPNEVVTRGNDWTKSDKPAHQPAPPNTSETARNTRSGNGSGEEFVEIFSKAAGIESGKLANISAAELADILGRTIASNTEQLMGLLRARASAKRLAKTSERTTIGAEANNPMKFVPSLQEALEIMFASNRPGYLVAPEAYEVAFNDLKDHEFATFSAMQTALHTLLDEMSPIKIEENAENGVFSSKKSKLWDNYVEWWDRALDDNDNGVLDKYLLYFSEAYEKAQSEK